MHTHVHAHANACRKVDRPKAWTGTNNQGSQKQVRSAGERHTRQQQPTMQKSTLFRVWSPLDCPRPLCLHPVLTSRYSRPFWLRTTFCPPTSCTLATTFHRYAAKAKPNRAHTGMIPAIIVPSSAMMELQKKSRLIRGGKLYYDSDRVSTHEHAIWMFFISTTNRQPYWRSGGQIARRSSLFLPSALAVRYSSQNWILNYFVQFDVSWPVPCKECLATPYCSQSSSPCFVLPAFG